MATTSTNLTVTIVTRTPDEEDVDLLLEAEINSEDNDGQTTYYTGESYTLRLFKSPNITSVKVGNNIGSVSKSGSGLTTSVPYEGEDAEYLVFTGSDSASLNKVYESGLSYSIVGSAYDVDGNPIGAPSLTPTKGSKNVVASKECFAVYEVSYTTKYDTYTFNSGTVGQMLIFFIGSN